VQILTSPPPDRRLIAAAIRHKSKPGLWLFRVLGVFLVLVALVDLLTSVSLAVFGIVLGLLSIFVVPPLLVSRAVGRCWRFFGTPGTFAITDRGVQRTDALTQHGYAWPALSGIEQLPGQLIFSLGKNGFLSMPTALLAPGELEHILATAAHHGVHVRLRR
jgi:hypothetical protein